MRAERIVSSYLLRLVQRGDRSEVTLYDLHRGELLVFDDHRSALAHLERIEGPFRAPPTERRPKGPPKHEAPPKEAPCDDC